VEERNYEVGATLANSKWDLNGDGKDKGKM
jgi:hypothetical protein